MEQPKLNPELLGKLLAAGASKHINIYKRLDYLAGYHERLLTKVEEVICQDEMIRVADAFWEALDELKVKNEV